MPDNTSVVEPCPPAEADNPRLAALKAAWQQATAQDREEFSKYLLRLTNEEFNARVHAMAATVSDQLWQTQP